MGKKGKKAEAEERKVGGVEPEPKGKVDAHVDVGERKAAG
jgi:hypothetical protein